MNGMLYVRGDAEDFDAWERRGNPGLRQKKAKQIWGIPFLPPNKQPFPENTINCIFMKTVVGFFKA